MDQQYWVDNQITIMFDKVDKMLTCMKICNSPFNKIQTFFRYWGHCHRHGESGQSQLNPDPSPGGAE